jgi:hypothetical protein
VKRTLLVAIEAIFECAFLRHEIHVRWVPEGGITAANGKKRDEAEDLKPASQPASTNMG